MTSFAAEGPYSNDIALILVTPVGGRAFRFSSHVQPICLPDLAAKRAAPEGSWCIVTGWGAQADDALDNLSPVLRAAAVPLLAQVGSTPRCWQPAATQMAAGCSSLTYYNTRIVHPCERWRGCTRRSNTVPPHFFSDSASFFCQLILIGIG